MTDTKKSRFTEGKIIDSLKQAAAGIRIKELCHKEGFSDATFCRWRAKFDGMAASDAKRPKDMEGENARRLDYNQARLRSSCRRMPPAIFATVHRQQSITIAAGLPAE